MTNANIFSEEWNREATEMEAELGGIRIGPLKPLGTPADDNEPDDEETLRQEEEALRQRLANQLKEMKEREANGREYLRQHGIVPNVDIPDGLGVNYASR